LPQSGQSGDGPSGSAGRDSATGELNGGIPGASGGSSSGSGGDYSLDTLPTGVFGGLEGTGADAGIESGAGTIGSGDFPGGPGGQSGTGAVLTSAEQAAVLDERLRQGYEDFDGFILGERERAQAESNAAGPSIIGSSGSGDGAGGAGSAGAGPQILSDGAGTGGVLDNPFPSSPVGRPSGQSESFPPPEDIPSGRDDDVVARQLREAAMTEPDPELRELLWEEYRNYTGIAGDSSGDSNE